MNFYSSMKLVFSCQINCDGSSKSCFTSVGRRTSGQRTVGVVVAVVVVAIVVFVVVGHKVVTSSCVNT